MFDCNETMRQTGWARTLAMLALGVTLGACGGKTTSPSDGYGGSSDGESSMAADAGGGRDGGGLDGARGTEAAPLDCSDATGREAAQQWCEALEARAACNGEDFRVGKCIRGLCCTLPFFRPDAPAAIATCLGELSCGESDDRCFDANQLGLTPRPEDAAYTEACLNKRTSCGNPFADDYCYMSVASEAFRDQVEACLARPCSEVRDCFRDVYRGPNACSL